jgi:hypothetical protein
LLASKLKSRQVPTHQPSVKIENNDDTNNDDTNNEDTNNEDNKGLNDDNNVDILDIIK